MTTTQQPTPGAKVHKFEIAGLGAFPYRFMGVTKKIFQAAPDAPVQPGSSCDYCGTGISLEYWLQSADGKRFKVGCDCILKTTSDRSLIVAVKTAKQQHEADLRQARAEKKRAAEVVEIAAAIERIGEVTAAWSEQPHPRAARGEFFANKTRMDWATWMLDNAGHAGRLTVARAIALALAEGGR